MTTPKNSCARWSSIAGLLTVACLAGSLSAQDRPRHVGLPDDWSHRHLVFSNPGTYVQMLDIRVSQKKWLNWLAVQNDPRFRMQQAKRAGDSQGWDSTPAEAPPPDNESLQAGNARVAELALERNLRAPEKATRRKSPTMQRDWNMNLGAAPPVNMYPAKFTFDVNGTPDCSNDYVVFPIGDFALVGQQAKLIAFNNLYRPGLCGPSTTPSFKFAYQLLGVVRGSPVLSLDGTKIAFVESRTSVSDLPNFHVLTIGTTGTNGNTTVGVSIGALGGNNAVDTFVQMATGSSVSISSPFVDYGADVAYVGDDHGNLHRFTGVFRGTLAEVVDGSWPVNVGADTVLTSPVAFNSIIYVGAGNGRLYCVNKDASKCSPNSSIAVGNVAILDAPIVDGSTGRIFVATQDAQRAILVQTATDLSQTITVPMGNRAPLGFDIHNGTFDNKYLTGADPSAGFMYFCGIATSGNAPTLYRVGFNAIGRVNSARDANALRLTNAVADNDVCSPLTEIYNPSTPGGPTDLLFVTIARNNHGCSGLNRNCLGSLDITSSFPSTFRSVFQLSASSGQGTSAIVIDNVADVVPTWLASTAYAVTTLIVDSNGNVQQCFIAGTSKAGAPPSWNTAVNSITIDNNVLWLTRGPYKGSWQRLRAYSLNDVITDGVLSTDGTLTPHLQRVTTAGTSGATQPTFSGSPTTDGGVTWTSLGAYSPSSVSSVYFSDVGAKLAYKLTQAGLQ